MGFKNDVDSRTGYSRGRCTPRRQRRFSKQRQTAIENYEENFPADPNISDATEAMRYEWLSELASNIPASE